MSVQPESKIPRLVNREPANLSWETIERLELDFDILNQHLDAKEKAVGEAVASDHAVKRLMDDIFNQALMCVDAQSRPDNIKNWRDKRDFAIQVLKQLQIALKEARDQSTQQKRVFEYRAEELEGRTTRTIEQLKSENFKTRTKYRAALNTLQANNLTIDEELLQQEIDELENVRESETEEDDMLRVRLTGQSEDEFGDEPSETTYSDKQANEGDSEIVDIPVNSTTEEFNPMVKTAKVNGKDVDTETGEVISIDSSELPIDDDDGGEVVTPALEPKKPEDTSLEQPATIVLHKDKVKAEVTPNGDRTKTTIAGHTLDELCIFENYDEAENIFKEMTNTESEVDENDKDVEDGNKPESSTDVDERMMTLLDFIGKTGAFQFSDFKLGGIDISDRDWRRYLQAMMRRGLLDARSVKSPRTTQHRIFALTEAGKQLVAPRIGRDPSESKILSWVRDHANIEHALGIYQLAEYFETDNWSVEYRRERTILETPDTKRLISPDLYIEKLEGTPGCRYIEFERGTGHTPEQLREWIDRRIEFSSRDIANRRWMIVLPSQELVHEYYGAVSQVWGDYYVAQGRAANYGATFIFKSIRKLFDDPNGGRIKPNETLPLGRHNPDIEYQHKSRRK